MPEAIELAEYIPPARQRVNTELLDDASMDLLRAYQELMEMAVAPAARAYIKRAMRTIAAVKRGCARAE